jgi:hypothetical protein
LNTIVLAIRVQAIDLNLVRRASDSFFLKMLDHESIGILLAREAPLLPLNDLDPLAPLEGDGAREILSGRYEFAGIEDVGVIHHGLFLHKTGEGNKCSIGTLADCRKTRPIIDLYGMYDAP